MEALRNILFLAFVIIAIGTITGILIHFIRELKRYKYVTNTYVLVLIMLGVCLIGSLVLNFNVDFTNVASPILNSFFDVAKMAVFAVDKDTINSAFANPDVWFWLQIVYAVVYLLTSLVTFAFLSTTIILQFGSIFFNAINTMKNNRTEDSDIHLIFTESQVSVSVHLAEELLKANEEEDGKKITKKNAVTVFVTRSSLKTQEGTEFRDALIGKGIQVKAQNFTKNLAEKIIKDYFPKYFREKKPFTKNVYIYCMFSDDSMSTLVANNFEEAITNNDTFTLLKNKQLTKYELDQLDKFRIYVTYQDNDIDLIYNYSGKTMHIISTLSQYDMVSSEFLLENPISNFVDINSLSIDSDNRAMHVTFVGLGMINRPIFEKMTYAYQLMGDNVNKINYHILDREADEKVKNISNMFTDKNNDLLLYTVDGGCTGEDLFEYETIDRYIKSLKEREDLEKENPEIAEKDKAHRFEDNGFELFIVSLKNGNFDTKVAKDLRKALFKYFGEERLSKTIIFLRIGEETVAKRIIEDDSTFIEQKAAKLVGCSLNVVAPFVVYGENALMPNFIANHYNDINDVGVVSSYAYEIQGLEKSDLNDEDEDYLKVRQNWLTKNKRKFIKNISVAYSLETKKVLLKMNSLKDVEERFGVLDAERYEKYDISDPVIKLANLEHNRWMAATYLNEKSIPFADDDNFLSFLNLNKGFEDGENKDLNTKMDDETRHVCMISNQRLRKLYDKCLEKGYKKAGLKLVFLNDILLAKKYFELVYNRVENNKNVPVDK